MAKPHFNKSVNVEAVGQLVEEDGELFILIDEDTNEVIDDTASSINSDAS